MKNRIAVAICGLMVLATLVVCFQPRTALSSQNSSSAVDSLDLANKRSPACTNLPDPGHGPSLKDNGCPHKRIEPNATERLTHTPFLPR